MIRRLRDRHRWLVLAVAVATMLTLGWAFFARPMTEAPGARTVEPTR